MSQSERKNAHLTFGTDRSRTSFVLVDDNGVTHLHAVISPEPVGDILEQTSDAIRRLDTLLRREKMEEGAVHQVVFLKEVGDKQLVRQLMIQYYGDRLPIINYVPQKPCDGRALLIEIHAMRSSGKSLQVKRCDEHIVTLDYADTKFVYVGDLVPDPKPIGSYPRSYSVFERMKEALNRCDFDMADLLRTWIYQGHIVLPEGQTQRYKELNRARTDFFKNIEFIKNLLPPIQLHDIYPASTGIGADDIDVTMACLAIQTKRDDVIAVPLENPDQTPAFDYGAVYSPQSPKFSRAMALAFDGHCTVYVSGTASITDSETRYIDDPAGQANQTLDNIEALIAGSNLKRHGIDGYHADLRDMVSARVYVKRPAYYDEIRAVCEKRFGDTPVIYSHADVCRDDLLVEIEGIASCQRLNG